MKILLTLLAVAVCTEATFNLGSLLGLLQPDPAPAPVNPGYAPYYRYAAAPADVQSGYASYYRQAPAPAPVQPAYASYYRQAAAPAPVQPAYASYYRQAAAPAPVQPAYASYYRHAAAPASVQPAYASYYRQAPAPAPVARPAQPAPIVRVVQPIVYVPRPSPPVTTYYEKIPVVSSSYTVREPKTEFNIVPSKSFSYTINEPADLTIQQLPRDDFRIVQSEGYSFNKQNSHSIQSDYTVEMVKSQGHSYSLPEEHVTIEKNFSPVSDFSVFPVDEPVHLDVRDRIGASAVAQSSAAAQSSTAVQSSAAAQSSTFAAASAEEVADEPTPLVQPIVVEPVVETNAVAVAKAEAAANVAAEPQAIAAVTLNHEHITQQILQEAIPNIIRQVAPHVIQQALPLVVDRAVPHIVHQVGSTVTQHQQQAEPVQIVTPFNQHQHQQNQNEKVVVMYATSVPQGQYDESENLVVPIGNRQQFNTAHAASHATATAQEQKVVFEKGLELGHQVQEEQRDVGNVNQQIINNFRHENAAFRHEFGGASGASSASSTASAHSFAQAGAGSFSNGHFQAHNVHPQLLHHHQ